MVLSRLERGDDKELMLRQTMRIPQVSASHSHQAASRNFCIAHDVLDYDSCREMTNERFSFMHRVASSRTSNAVSEGLQAHLGKTSQYPTPTAKSIG